MPSHTGHTVKAAVREQPAFLQGKTACLGWQPQLSEACPNKMQGEATYIVSPASEQYASLGSIPNHLLCSELKLILHKENELKK